MLWSAHAEIKETNILSVKDKISWIWANNMIFIQSFVDVPKRQLRLPDHPDKSHYAPEIQISRQKLHRRRRRGAETRSPRRRADDVWRQRGLQRSEVGRRQRQASQSLSRRFGKSFHIEPSQKNR